MACACTSPPGVPKAQHATPRRDGRRLAGVSRGRCPAPLGWHGLWAQDCEPRDDGQRPVPGTIGDSNETSLGVADTVLPQRSTTQM